MIRDVKNKILLLFEFKPPGIIIECFQCVFVCVLCVCFQCVCVCVALIMQRRLLSPGPVLLSLNVDVQMVGAC